MAAQATIGNFEPVVCVVGFHHARSMHSILSTGAPLANVALGDRRLRLGLASKMAPIRPWTMTGHSFPLWPCQTVLTRKACPALAHFLRQSRPFFCIPFMTNHCSHHSFVDPLKTSPTSRYAAAPLKALRRFLPLRSAYRVHDSWMQGSFLISRQM